jgi:nitrous oxide reductase accessory protein NosL
MRVFFIWLLLASTALAHSWYEAECCSGQDCQQVSPMNVKATAAGWLVQLTSKDHPLVKAPFSTIIPYDSPKVHKSQDENFHVCFGPKQQILFCIYVPEMGT